VAKYQVRREFTGSGRRLKPGDKVDSDEVNAWRNGQALLRQRFLTPVQEKGRKGSTSHE
jgi:hypothetical protein